MFRVALHRRALRFCVASSVARVAVRCCHWPRDGSISIVARCAAVIKAAASWLRLALLYLDSCAVRCG